MTGSLTWEDILGERTGWDILIWMGTLEAWLGCLATSVVAVFADFVSQHLAGFDWFWASFIISATFVYSVFLLPVVRRVLRLYSRLCGYFSGDGAPFRLRYCSFGLMNSPGCTLTHYSSGVTPIFFIAGYVHKVHGGA